MPIENLEDDQKYMKSDYEKPDKKILILKHYHLPYVRPESMQGLLEESIKMCFDLNKVDNRILSNSDSESVRETPAKKYLSQPNTPNQTRCFRLQKQRNPNREHQIQISLLAVCSYCELQQHYVAYCSIFI